MSSSHFLKTMVFSLHHQISFTTKIPKSPLEIPRFPSLPNPNHLTSDRSIEAYNCTSLEVLPCHSIFSNFIPESYNGIKKIVADFGNCFKLDRNKLEDIVNDALLKTQKQQDEDIEIIWAPVLCYPGSKIPDWFNFQSKGAFINVELRPDYFNQKFLGFALCIVAAPCPDHQDDSKVLCIVWDCRLKSKDEHLPVRSGSFGPRSYGGGEYIGSKHVFVESCFPISPSELLCYGNEVSFQFYVYGQQYNDRQPNDYSQTNRNNGLVLLPRESECFQYYKVENCGVHLLLGQHLEEDDGSSSSQIGEDEDEEDDGSSSSKIGEDEDVDFGKRPRQLCEAVEVDDDPLSKRLKFI